MTSYYGDFAEDDTVNIPFNTFTSNDPQASSTITNLADADIKVHKDAGLTQIATDGATVVINFDSITGNHMITIDTSAHADYSTGSEYAVRIEGTTVDAGTINAWVGSFSIERAGGVLALMKATTLASIKAETALIVADTNELQTDNVPGLISTLDDVVDTVKVDTAAILVDTAVIGATGSGLTSLATQASVNTIDDFLDTEIAAITAAVITNAAGTDIAADIIAVKAETASILTDTGTTLDTKINNIQGATFNNSTDSLEAIRNRGDAAWTTGAGGSDRLLMVDTTIATLASQTSFTLNAGSADDDAYNNCTIVIEDVSTSTQKAVGIVSGYTGATKTVTLKYDPAIFTIAATDKIYILAENALKSTAANRQLDVTATGAAGIDWGNVENPTTAVDLSATDIQLADTTTTLTNLPSITSNWLTAAGIAASALNGKGNWNIGKTGYSLTQTFPTNFADMSITVTTGRVDVDSVSGTAQTANDNGADINAILIDTAVIGTAGAGLTAIPWNASWDAEVQSECTDALNAYGGPTNTQMETRTPTASQLTYMTDHAATAPPVTFTGGGTTTAILGNVDGSAASTVDDFYNGRVLIFNAGTLNEQATDITAYVGSTATATITAVTTAVTSSHTAIMV